MKWRPVRRFHRLAARAVARVLLPAAVLSLSLFVVADANPNPSVKALGKGKHFRSAQGDELLVTPVTLDDGTTVDVLGGTVDGVTLEAPDDQPSLKVGQRVKKEKHGDRWRLVPEDSKESWFGASVAHAYTYGGHRWKDKTFRYSVNASNPSSPSTISAQQMQEALIAAAGRWVQQTAADIHVTSVGLTNGNTVANNGRNEVFWREGVSDVVGRFAATYFYWGGDGYLLDADTVFYKGWGRFNPMTGCTSGVFLDDGYTHEAGHALGFGHSAFATATMFPFIPSGCDTSWRSLSADDIAAARAAYGSVGSIPSQMPETPRLLTPTNNGAPPDNYLRWYAVAGATSYDIYFGAVNAPPYTASVAPPNCTCVSTWKIGTLYFPIARVAGARYTWRIVAKNASGAATSSIWSFVG